MGMAVVRFLEDLDGDRTMDRTEFDSDGRVVSILQRNPDGSVTMSADPDGDRTIDSARTFDANGEIGASPPDPSARPNPLSSSRPHPDHERPAAIATGRGYLSPRTCDQPRWGRTCDGWIRPAGS